LSNDRVDDKELLADACASLQYVAAALKLQSASRLRKTPLLCIKVVVIAQLNCVLALISLFTSPPVFVFVL
jgi:hypothetical protein